MANSTTNKKKTSKSVATVAQDDTVKENEMLKDELTALRSQIAVLMQAQSQNSLKESKSENKNIPFINMTPATIVLKGSQVWKIEKQFTVRLFRESEAELIVNNMPKLIASGAVYIANHQFVLDHNLGEIYEYLLTDEELKQLLTQNPNIVVDTYRNASDGQKRIIETMITEKVINRESIDANIMREIGAISGIDFLNMEAFDAK